MSDQTNITKTNITETTITKTETPKPDRKRRTISLTGRAPVEIYEEDWPTIASADWYNGQHECQANETAFIKVREHKDGRRLVYGKRDSGPGGMSIGYRGARAGELLPCFAEASETPAAILRVAEDIMPELGQECIQDLPADRLT